LPVGSGEPDIRHGRGSARGVKLYQGAGYRCSLCVIHLHNDGLIQRGADSSHLLASTNFGDGGAESLGGGRGRLGRTIAAGQKYQP
jgi:hypothetical protein